MHKKYKARKNPDGTLSIFDLEVMGALEAGEKGLKKRFGAAEMHQAVAMHKKFLASGQNMFGYRGHNAKDRAAPVISILNDPYVDDEREMLVARETRISDPDVIPRFLRGEMPKRSAEFHADPPFVAGLAFLEGNLGHQNYSGQLSDIQIELLKLSEGAELITSEIETPIELQFEDENMAFTEEQKAELIALIKQVMQETVSPAVEEQVTLALEKRSDTLSPDSQKLIDKALSKHKLELDSVRKESDIDSKVMVLLHSESNVYTEKQLRTMFSDEDTLKTYGGRAGLFQYMKLQNEVGTVKLSAELMNVGGNAEAELTEEYKRLWPDESRAPVTLSKYVSDNKDAYNMTHA